MTLTPTQLPLADCITRSLMRAALMLFFAGAIMSAALFAWISLKTFSTMRMYALLGGIAAGLGATICLAGALHFVDTPLNHDVVPPWYLRWLLKSMKRILMFAQLVCMGLAAASVTEMLFDLGIPGL